MTDFDPLTYPIYRCSTTEYDEDDIYGIYERDVIRENTIRFPYKSNVSDLSADEKNRLDLKAESKGLKRGSLYEAACSSPEAWVMLVQPDVSRQSSKKEEVLRQYLVKGNGIPIVNLGTAKNTAKWLFKGKVCQYNDLPKGFNNFNKSLDLYYHDENIEIAFVAKYTKSNGGAQDNQKNDALSFFLNNQRRSSDVQLILCLDGDYYQQPRIKDSIQQAIKQHRLTGNTFAGNYKEVSNRLFSLFPKR